MEQLEVENAGENEVVKAVEKVHWRSGFLDVFAALSPPPPKTCRNGESDAQAVKVRRAVSAMWTSVYADDFHHMTDPTFTTSMLALLEARRGSKPYGGTELRSNRPENAERQVVKAEVIQQRAELFRNYSAQPGAPVTPSRAEKLRQGVNAVLKNFTELTVGISLPSRESMWNVRQRVIDCRVLNKEC